MRKLYGLALAATAAAVFSASPANATVVLCYVTGSGTPQCPKTDSNVNVDKMTGTPVVGVSTVTGHLNDDFSQGLKFTSTGETLVGDGSGLAVVSALDGSLNTNLTFQLIGQTFNLVTFNLNPHDGQTPDAGSVQVSYIPTFGTSPQTITLSPTGQNFFGIYGNAGEQLQSITFSNFSPTPNGIADIRQTKVGGVQPVGGVPEPSTWAMMLFGFGAVGFGLRRKDRKSVGRLRLAI